MRNENEEEVSISFRTSVSYRNTVHATARSRGMNIKEFVTAAIEAAVSGSSVAEVARARSLAALNKPGHQSMAVPEELVPVVEFMLKWYAKRQVQNATGKGE